MVISMDMVFTIGGFLFSTHFFFPPTMKAQDIWMSLSLECHISFLKQDRIVVRALGSRSTPCNKSSVSKLQLSKPQNLCPAPQGNFVEPNFPHISLTCNRGTSMGTSACEHLSHCQDPVCTSPGACLTLVILTGPDPYPNHRPTTLSQLQPIPREVPRAGLPWYLPVFLLLTGMIGEGLPGPAIPPQRAPTAPQGDHSAPSALAHLHCSKFEV